MKTIGLVFDGGGEALNAADVFDFNSDLENMTVTQLREFAANAGIELSVNCKKAEMLNSIRQAINEAKPN